MNVDLKAGIVRVLKLSGETSGTGFVVSDEGLIATCAHVVEAAGAGPGDNVRVVFHATGKAREARVEPDWWRAPNAQDVTLLRLAGTLPEGAVSLPLRCSAGAEGRFFFTFGFPEAKPVEGMASRCEVIGRTTEAGFPVLQLRSSEVGPGFSGAPVQDTVTRHVVGMISAITTPDRYGRLTQTAFMIPTDALVEACPELAESCMHADTLPHEPIARNPPPLPTHFKGRRIEIESLKVLFQRKCSRIALVGLGGIGKTSLAIAAIQELERENRFRDGVLWLDGRQYTNLDTLVMRLGELLRLDLSQRALAEQRILVHRGLKDKDTLAIVDSFESVAEPVTVIDFLRGLPCDVLITSRLQRPEFRDPIEVDPLARDVALELFKILSHKSFEDDPEAEALCNEDLGRHPLAIEVVAALVKTGMSPTELRQVLRKAPRDVLDTHKEVAKMQSVVQALDMSYQRLTQLAQTVLSCASVFLADFDLGGLGAVLPDQPRLRLAKAIQELEARSLVHSTGPRLYRLHTVTRQYAYGRLEKRSVCHLRAADYYASIRKLKSGWKTIDDVNPQLTEFEHRFSAEDYDGACEVLDLIDYDYLILWGYYSRVLKLRERLQRQEMAPHLEAANLANLGRAYRNLGQPEQAIELYDQAIEIADPKGWGKLVKLVKLVRFVIRNRRLPLRTLRTCVCTLRQTKGISLGLTGNACHDLGRVNEAIGLYEQAIDIARRDGPPERVAIWLGDLGNAYLDLGQVEQAIEYYREALEITKEKREKEASGGDLGTAYRAQGLFKQAIEYLEEALDIAREIGHRRNEVMRLNSLGNAYRDQGNAEQAIKLYEEGLKISRDIGFLRGQSYQLLGLGRALLASGELSSARQNCEEARDLNVPETSYQAMLTLGIVLLHQGEDLAAGREFEAAVNRCQTILSQTENLYRALYTLATALVGQAVCDLRWANEGERPELLAPALDKYCRALDNCSALGVVGDALRDLGLIRAARIHGLEPVFELLESARAEGTPADQAGQDAKQAEHARTATNRARIGKDSSSVS